MAQGSRLTGVADGLSPRKRAGMPDVITCTSEGDDPSGRRRQGVNRPDDVPAVRRKGASPVPGYARPARRPTPGNPRASRMIPLESPVPEIGTPGLESGGRKRAHGCRTAARRESAGRATDPLPATRLPSTLHEWCRYPFESARGCPPRARGIAPAGGRGGPCLAMRASETGRRRQPGGSRERAGVIGKRLPRVGDTLGKLDSASFGRFLAGLGDDPVAPVRRGRP